MRNGIFTHGVCMAKCGTAARDLSPSLHIKAQTPHDIAFYKSYEIVNMNIKWQRLSECIEYYCLFTNTARHIHMLMLFMLCMLCITF